MERVQHDFSIGVTFNDTRIMVDRVYDNVHIFDWLGYSILKLITEEGFRQVPLTMEQGQQIANAAGITPVYRPEITESEHEHYLMVQALRLEEQFGDLNG